MAALIDLHFFPYQISSVQNLNIVHWKLIPSYVTATNVLPKEIQVSVSFRYTKHNINLFFNHSEKESCLISTDYK